MACVHCVGFFRGNNLSIALFICVESDMNYAVSFAEKLALLLGVVKQEWTSWVLVEDIMNHNYDQLITPIL